MSITLATMLALAAGTGSAITQTAVENEIIVIAKKLEMIRYTLSVDKAGVMRSCTITRSSGDAELDPMLCNAMRACNSQFQFIKKNKKMLPPCLKQEMSWRQRELAQAREVKSAQN